ncbi:MAG: PAS domain-containing protein, partial [Wenzhouxiangella sp.]
MSQPDPDHLATGLIRVDPQHRVSWINRAAADLFGRSRAALLNLPLSELSVALDDWHQRMGNMGQP